MLKEEGPRSFYARLWIFKLQKIVFLSSLDLNVAHSKKKKKMMLA